MQRNVHEAGKTGFGEGARTASDFDDDDWLKSTIMIALVAAGSFAFVAGFQDNSHDSSQRAPVPVEHTYRFNNLGDTKTIHDNSTNKTYEFEFDGVKRKVDRW